MRRIEVGDVRITQLVLVLVLTVARGGFQLSNASAQTCKLGVVFVATVGIAAAAAAV